MRSLPVATMFSRLWAEKERLVTQKLEKRISIGTLVALEGNNPNTVNHGSKFKPRWPHWYALLLSAYLNAQERVYPWVVPPPGVRSMSLIDMGLTFFSKKKT